MNQTLHKPVMVEQVLSSFADVSLKVFFDGTVGAGGHARAILEAHPEIETYIACDKDPAALAIAAQNLEPFKKKIKFVHSDHAYVEEVLQELSIQEVDGFFLI